MKNLILFLGLCISFFANAQDLNQYSKQFFIQDSDTLPYRILLPENYNPAKKYPLVLFLHGSGERGNDNEKQLVHGARLFLKEEVRKQFPAIVVFPQCPKKSYWSNVDFKMNEGKRAFTFKEVGEPSLGMKLTQQLLFQLFKEYKIDKRKVYVGGLSMGGMGTFEIVQRNPKMFAAAFPICGGGEPATAPKMKKVKWWVFHGAKDDVVPSELSQQMVDALKDAGASVKFTLYPNANHNSWDAAFAEPDLLPWLFKQKR